MYLLKHIRQAHAHRPGFQITCSLSGCQRTFRSFGAYRNHIYDCHTESELTQADYDEETPVDEVEYMDTATMEGPSRKKSSAVWILKVQETYKLTQSTMEKLLGDVTGLVQDLLTDLYDEVKFALKQSNVDDIIIAGLSTLFGNDSPFANPFRGLETKHLQLKFYEDEMNLVVSLCLLAGLRCL